jgi:oligopeptide/dipeptide ABC transporter ATP-binding protein
VTDLRVTFHRPKPLLGKARPPVIAVNGVSFDVAPGETLGLVGESGCGKSTTARAIAGLIPGATGSARFMGDELIGAPAQTIWEARRDLQMIFQDPYASLNPRMTVGAAVREPLEVFNVFGEDTALRQRYVQQLFETVGLDPLMINRYPHEFSGGQRQRVGIARALALRPSLIMCDEPVSALDVSIQAQIVNLLEELRDKFKIAYLFIAHDLAVVEHISHRVAVMYLGKIVEITGAAELYRSPQHPYTRALLSAIPPPDPDAAKAAKRIMLTGELPSPDAPRVGCDFANRCPLAQQSCKEQVPELVEVSPGHFAACPVTAGEKATA